MSHLHNSVPLSAAQLSGLTASFKGELIAPEAANYDEARRLWNGVIDKKPALIARPKNAADVQQAVHFAAEHHLPLSVRGGGHNVAGQALCSGVVVDMSLMRGLQIDAANRVGHVQGGATWAEVDAAAQEDGLATPGGLVSDTGVAGLTLGGGLGWLRRKLGLSCDQVRAFQVVTLGGELLRADATEHADLYWALRGGGSGLGIVTEFEFNLYPIGPEVMFVMTFYPASRGLEVLWAYRELTAAAPDEVSAFAICGLLPEAELFPAEAHGEPFVLLAAMYAGNPQDGEQVLRPWREITQPIADFSGIQPFTQVQKIFDEDYPVGRRYYWKSSYLSALPDEALELALKLAAEMPSPLSTIDLWQLGGAIDRVQTGATAYAQRGSPYMLGVEANWDEPQQAALELNVAWARRCIQAFGPYSTGDAYLNFPGFEDDSDSPLNPLRQPSVRLQAVKQKYSAIQGS